MQCNAMRCNVMQCNAMQCDVMYSASLRRRRGAAWREVRDGSTAKEDTASQEPLAATSRSSSCTDITSHYIAPRSAKHYRPPAQRIVMRLDAIGSPGASLPAHLSDWQEPEERERETVGETVGSFRSFRGGGTETRRGDLSLYLLKGETRYRSRRADSS